MPPPPTNVMAGDPPDDRARGGAPGAATGGGGRPSYELLIGWVHHSRPRRCPEPPSRLTTFRLRLHRRHRQRRRGEPLEGRAGLPLAPRCRGAGRGGGHGRRCEATMRCPWGEGTRRGTHHRADGERGDGSRDEERGQEVQQGIMPGGTRRGAGVEMGVEIHTTIKQGRESGGEESHGEEKGHGGDRV